MQKNYFVLFLFSAFAIKGAAKVQNNNSTMKICNVSDTMPPNYEKYDDKPYTGDTTEDAFNKNKEYLRPYYGPLTRMTKKSGGTPPFFPEVPLRTIPNQEKETPPPKERETKKI